MRREGCPDMHKNWRMYRLAALIYMKEKIYRCVFFKYSFCCRYSYFGAITVIYWVIAVLSRAKHWYLGAITGIFGAKAVIFGTTILLYLGQISS